MSGIESKAKVASDIRSVTMAAGVEIQYEGLGTGSPVALLHGALSSRYTFSRQRDVLAASRRLILPSARGHDGVAPILPDDYGVATSDVRDFATVLDAENVDRVDVIGHSSGGATAFAFAREFPDRVNRLILIEPTLVALLPPRDRDALTTDLKAIIEKGEADGDMAALRATMGLLGGAAWAGLDDNAQSRQLTAMSATAPVLAPHWRAILALAVSPEDLKALQTPTCLIYGRDSYEFEAALSACWRTNRPDIPQILVDSAGHNSHRDRPDIVNPAIIDFLDGNGSGG